MHHLDAGVLGLELLDQHIHRIDARAEVVLPVFDLDHVILRQRDRAQRQNDDRDGKNGN